MRNKIRNGISHGFYAILPQQPCISHTYLNHFSLGIKQHEPDLKNLKHLLCT